MTRILALAVVATACGGLDGTVGLALPLVTIEARLVGDLADHRAPDAEAPVNLRAGLVWAENPDFDQFCIGHGRNSLLSLLPPGLGGRGGAHDSDVVLTDAAEVGCADSLRFVPGRVAASVPISAGPGASFLLELPYLPAADDLRGIQFDRVVYGSVVIWDDVDGSGTLEIIRAKTSKRRDDEDHEHDEDGRPRPGGPGAGTLFHEVVDAAQRDVVHGAAFVTMAEAHTRVVFREGAFGTAPGYYPAIDCDPPPAGFSVMTVEGSPIAPQCRYEPIEELRIDVPVRAPSEVRDVACGLPRSLSEVRPSSLPELPEGLATDCLRDFDDVKNDLQRERLEQEQTDACAISCISVTEMAISDRRAACPGVLHFDLCAGLEDGECEVRYLTDTTPDARPVEPVEAAQDDDAPKITVRYAPRWWTCLPPRPRAPG